MLRLLVDVVGNKSGRVRRGRCGGHSRGFRPGPEMLERREVMTIGFYSEGSAIVIDIQGTSHDDRAVVQMSDPGWFGVDASVNVTLESDQPDGTVSREPPRSFPASTIARIEFHGFDGNDSFIN